MHGILRGLLGLILVLGLLVFVFLAKWPGLLGMVLAIVLLLYMYGEKAKKVLLRMTKTILLGLSGLILAFGLLYITHTWQIHFHAPEGEPMFTSTSPDNRFTVAAYPSPTIYFRFAMPGQGADGPALIILKDNRTGKELQRQHVDGPWFVYDDIDWDWDKDTVKLARGDGIEWKLPR